MSIYNVYFFSVDDENFKQMQDSQKLCINFKDYASLCKKLLNNCINEPQRYLIKIKYSFIAVFIMQKEGTARLDFIQNIEYKFIELLSLDFINSPDDVVRKQISFRYNALKTKLAMYQDRINTISNIVKIKNPSLLLQIQKTPAKLQNSNTSMYRNLSTNKI
jgi:hypothetical protein